MGCDYVYDFLWCIVGCVCDRVSKRGHFGLVSRSWEESCVYFEVGVVLFGAFVIAIVFFIPKFLV